MSIKFEYATSMQPYEKVVKKEVAEQLLEELIKLRNYLDDVAQSIDAQRFIDSADLIINKALGETK